MRVRLIVTALAATLFLLSGPGEAADGENHSPQLLLTPKLLRRLQRDHIRQTVRWQNFEKRVETASDSPERGFELALFYAVTHDETRGKEAVSWALAHQSETRQVALVLDWAGDVMSPEQEHKLSQWSQNLPLSGQSPAWAVRDWLFKTVLQGNFDHTLLDRENRYILRDLHKSHAVDPENLYASVEYLTVLRSAKRTDLRDADPRFFAELPKTLLLSLKPAQVEHPDWRVHAAALALVTLDPNLESSGYLQAWAMEDSQMVREGPGVAYELLWADPYLPGIAYQNLDPWIYDPTGTLFARVGWQPDACWISVARGKYEQQNCPAQSLPTIFGNLHLLSMPGTCAELPVHARNETILLWKLKPGTEMIHEHGQERTHGMADPAGMWLVPNDPGGKICQVSKNQAPQHR
jgi:hypothetical protein